MKQSDLPLIAAAATAIYFLSFTAPGLTAHFAPDDLQNIYRYWIMSGWDIARANLQVATSAYRPLGALFYLPLFKWFGFNPLPYRVVLFAVVALNVWLLYCLAWRVTGSREAAGFATLVGCFHSSALAAYYSTAVLYEGLCFTFTIGALLYYVRARESETVLRWKQIVIVVLLTAAALNSKEMAAVIAPSVVIWEILYRNPIRRRPMLAEYVPLVLIGLLSVAWAGAKMSGQDALTQFEAYKPVFTVARYMETTRVYAGFVFLSDEPLTNAEAIAFWAGAAVLALLLRNRAMIFGIAFAWMALLPVNFVTAREGFVLYIPMAGFGIYVGALLKSVLDFAGVRLRFSRDVRLETGAIMFTVVLVFLAVVHVPRARLLHGAMENAQRATWEMVQSFRDQKVRFKPGERVYFANTPFYDWDVYFLAKLWSGDPSVKVAISGPGMKEIRGDAHDNFDQEFRFEGAKVGRVK